MSRVTIHTVHVDITCKCIYSMLLNECAVNVHTMTRIDIYAMCFLNRRRVHISDREPGS